MSVTPGSSTKLNHLTGVVRLTNLTNAEKTSLAEKVLKANILIVDEDRKIYLTDGVKKISELTPVVDTTIAPLTNAMREALNKTFSGDSGAYKATEGGFVVLGAAGGDGHPKIADVQLNLVDQNGHLVATYLQDVLTDSNGIIKLEKLPSQMRQHMVFVENYAALAGLTPEQKLNMVWVIDASDDPSGKVESGWAIYVWNIQGGVATGDPIKAMEGEGLDIDFDAIASTYENIQKAGAVMYDHPLQMDAPTLTNYVSLLEAEEEEETPEEPELTTTLDTKPGSYTGETGAEVEAGLVFGGTETGNIVVTLTATGCMLKDTLGENSEQASLTKTDTIANVNSWLEGVVVVVGASEGSVVVHCDKIVGDTTIPVTVTPAV